MESEATSVVRTKVPAVVKWLTVDPGKKEN